MMSTKTYQVEAVDSEWYQRSVKCLHACPLHINAGKYASLIAEGDYGEALKVIRERLPFPGILGEICYHPCELACKMVEEEGRAIPLCSLKQFVARQEDEPLVDCRIVRDREEKVAVVGGGPAGMLAAYDLRKMGFNVVLFEANDKLGGLLIDGIPPYRLPKEVVEKELGILEKLGIEMRLQCRVGKDISLKQLRDDYSAVFISVGGAAAKEMMRAEKELSFNLTRRGTFKVNPLTLETNITGFFAGGDAVRGPGTVIDAMAEGRTASFSIERYLSEEGHSPAGEDGLTVSGRSEVRGRLSLVSEEKGIVDLLASRKQVLSEQAAQEEGGRCLKCFVTPAFDSEKCILCGACVDVCPGYCLKMVRLKNLEGDVKVDEMVKGTLGLTLKTFKEDAQKTGEGTSIIKDDDRCLHCKLCEIRCPTGAIVTDLF
jgi:NAD-dependent dihydropyrimidine dehydrogenase PreA subunit